MTFWERKESRRNVLKTLALASGAIMVSAHHKPWHKTPPGHAKRNMSNNFKGEIAGGITVDDMDEPYSMEIIEQ